MSTTGGSEQAGAAPTEEELRAAYEAEIKKIRVEHVLLEHVVTLVNLGMRRRAYSRAPRRSATSSKSGWRSTASGLSYHCSSGLPRSRLDRSAMPYPSCSWRSSGSAALNLRRLPAKRADLETKRPRPRPLNRRRTRKVSRRRPSQASPVPPSAAAVSGCPDSGSGPRALDSGAVAGPRPGVRGWRPFVIAGALRALPADYRELSRRTPCQVS